MTEAPCAVSCINGGTCVLAKANCSNPDAPFDTPACDCGAPANGACFYGARCEHKLACGGTATACLRFVPQGRGTAPTSAVCGTGGDQAAACAVAPLDARAIESAVDKMSKDAEDASNGNGGGHGGGNGQGQSPRAEDATVDSKEAARGGAATTGSPGDLNEDRGSDGGSSGDGGLVVVGVVVTVLLMACLAIVAVVKMRREREREGQHGGKNAIAVNKMSNFSTSGERQPRDSKNAMYGEGEGVPTRPHSAAARELSNTYTNPLFPDDNMYGEVNHQEACAAPRKASYLEPVPQGYSALRKASYLEPAPQGYPAPRKASYLEPVPQGYPDLHSPTLPVYSDVDPAEANQPLYAEPASMFPPSPQRHARIVNQTPDVGGALAAVYEYQESDAHCGKPERPASYEYDEAVRGDISVTYELPRV